MRSPHVIYGVHITNRVEHAVDVQRVFTEFGRSIRTRLGLHDVHDNYSSPGGLILLEMMGKPAELRRFEKKLKAIKGVHVQKMTFPH
ncbi:MAG: hypothetical protein NTW87_35500 [Planctomycetota bacterium]|nr:hypothetical protein [Planctomycetota bacterium]